MANDYAKRLHIGEVECRDVMSTALNNLAVKKDAKAMDLKFCEYLNISVCPHSETGNVSNGKGMGNYSIIVKLIMQK